ncbi:hypothetical protein N1851_016620 [Merluccius polli]|uniref:Uncharacterized protein n=1 Tax=Merluccius polli TaxID=89951 RepID=A0AA47NN22_MERPO|nr:hypothetical protein N1851_033975 [Merluccius polli]KAK0131328.1 hypothetical protein N1851_033977 [Merluccius polli]KAK0144808.1 hypothetical protein N1851_016620 [Merluccius polli]
MDEIRRDLAAVFPDYSEELINSLMDALKAGGVHTLADLEYIREEDMFNVLLPATARRLVTWARSKSVTPALTPASVCASPQSSRFLTHTPSSSPSSPLSVSSMSPVYTIPSSSINWIDKFEIPWAKLPEELMQCLSREKRPSPKHRREMIRIVVSDMMNVCNSPSKQNATEIAKRMVTKYPKSLQDVIEGDVIGSGYDSLAKQLLSRVENAKRSDIPKVKRRKHSSDADTDEITAAQRASVQDTYGCVKWDPKYMPVSETVESQNIKKEEMKKMYEEMNDNAETVKALILATYFSQRGEINKGVTIKNLCEEWPFLFKEVGMAAHFEELTGLIGTFMRNFERKGKRLLEFLKHVVAPKNNKVHDALIKCQTEKGPSGSCTEMIEVITLLMSHFGEGGENLFHFIEDTCLAQEIEFEKLPVNPCIIVCGSSCFAAKTFMLSIDQEVVNDRITSFMSTFCLMFGSYYSFNIHYPVELRSTLEFLQRCFFTINPERGTKVEWKKNKKVLQVNPRVLTLIADLADYEWR